MPQGIHYCHYENVSANSLWGRGAGPGGYIQLSTRRLVNAGWPAREASRARRCHAARSVGGPGAAALEAAALQAVHAASVPHRRLRVEAEAEDAEQEVRLHMQRGKSQARPEEGYNVMRLIPLLFIGALIDRE